MKVKPRQRKSFKWKKRAIARRRPRAASPKVRGRRNPFKKKHIGGKGL